MADDVGDLGGDLTRSQAPAIAGATSSAEIAPDDVFDDEPERYAVTGRIGAGGMGTVLAATGSRLGRPVAIKVVTADREDLRRRFEREAQVTARLQHPAIVPVYGSGRGRSGQPFYAMKQVTGEPLDRVIRDAATLPLRIALLPKVIAVTEAIAYAHAERVIHRDLKPANILVGAFGETVVIDWGLAKDLALPDDEAASVSPYRNAGGGDETAIGKVMGTPAYMPLEQARGERVDERADVYSLGAILYHVLAGAPPYARADEGSAPWESMLARVIAAPPPALATLQPEAPADLLAIVARAMAREPADRYPSAGELAEDLRRFQTGQLVGAHRYSTWQLVTRWVRRHRGAVIVASVAVALIAALGAFSLHRIFEEEERTTEQRNAAVASRGQAEDLMSFMLVNLKDKLQPLGKLDLLDDVATKAIAYYDQKREELSSDELAKRALARVQLGDVLSYQGHNDRALDQYRESLAIRTGLVASNPTNLDWQRGVAVSHEKIGNILVMKGDIKGAQSEYEIDNRLDLDLVAKDPSSTRLSRNLAASYQKLGDVEFAQGNTSRGLDARRKQLAIMEGVASRNPGNADFQRDLAAAHNQMGDALSTHDDVVGAIVEYGAYRKLSEQLLAQDPANLDSQTNTAYSILQLGKALARHGENAEALVDAKRSVDLFESLAARDPGNAERQNNLAIVHDWLGDIYSQNDPARALIEYRQVITISEPQAEKDPANTVWRVFVAQAHEKMGRIYIGQKSWNNAKIEFAADQGIETTLAKLDPHNVDWQWNAAVAREDAGDLLDGEGDLRRANDEYVSARSAMSSIISTTSPDEARKASLVHLDEKLAALRKQIDGAPPVR